MPNNLCHFEFMTSDPQKTRAFLSGLFSWQFDDASMPGYTLVNTGQEPTGGIFQKPEGTPNACVNIYFHVENIDATISKAGELGAKILVPKTEIPGIGHFALFSDPDGIPIGVMQPTT